MSLHENEMLKTIVENTNLSWSKIKEILKDHDVSCQIVDSELNDGKVTSPYDITKLIEENKIDSIAPEYIKYINLEDIELLPGREYVLDALYSDSKIIDIHNLDTEKRKFIYDYLVNKDKTESITFGMTYENDISMLKSGKEPNLSLDFYNWNHCDLSIFNDVEYRNKLLSHICYLIKEDNFWVSQFLEELCLNYNGYELLDIALEKYDRETFLLVMDTIFKNDDYQFSIPTYEKLKMYPIKSDRMVYLMMSYSTWAMNCSYYAQYLNIDSVVRYIKNANMHIKNNSLSYGDNHYQKDILERAIKNYKHNMTNANDDRIISEYIHSSLFTLTPIILKFGHIKSRYLETGYINMLDLIDCEIGKYEYNEFVDFMLAYITVDQVNKMIECDKWLQMEIFRENKLSISQTISLVNKFENLVVYYAV